MNKYKNYLIFIFAFVFISLILIILTFFIDEKWVSLIETLISLFIALIALKLGISSDKIMQEIANKILDEDVNKEKDSKNSNLITYKIMENNKNSNNENTYIENLNNHLKK